MRRNARRAAPLAEAFAQRLSALEGAQEGRGGGRARRPIVPRRSLRDTGAGRCNLRYLITYCPTDDIGGWAGQASLLVLGIASFLSLVTIAVLWAAALILCLTLYHFGRQRKLRDENAVSFFWMACLSLLVCALGIALTQMQRRRRGRRGSSMAAATPLYLAQALLPWVMLRFISTRLIYDAGRRRRVALVGLLPTLLNASLIVLNVRFDLISSISAEGLLCVESMFPLYVGIMLAGFLLDLCYVVQCGEALGPRNVNAAAEACIILSVGVFVQHYLHIQLFFGFAAALAMFVLHLTLKNPYAYIDIATHTFNARYFALCMREALPRAVGDAIVAVELCQLERVERVYASGSGAALDACVAERLMQISPRAFRLAPGRFALWVRDAAEAEAVSFALEALMGEGFYLGEDAVSCGASYVALPLADGWQSVEELSAFIDFLLRPASGKAEIARVAYTPEARHAFDEMREVERYLEEAVCNDLFEVWYQPVCSLADERYVSLEALSRLHHPTLGWIPPDMFIRAAIHSGQMRRITPLQLGARLPLCAGEQTDLRGHLQHQVQPHPGRTAGRGILPEPAGHHPRP